MTTTVNEAPGTGTGSSGTAATPVLRVVAVAEARDGRGGMHDFLHPVEVSPAPAEALAYVGRIRYSTAFAGEVQSDFYADADGRTYESRVDVPLTMEALARNVDGGKAGFARQPLGPFGGRPWDGLAVMGESEAEVSGIPDLAWLRSTGKGVTSDDAEAVAAACRKAFAASYAWTGEAVAVAAELPHWNVACSEGGAVRLECRRGYPVISGRWSVGAAFPIHAFEQAKALATRVAREVTRGKVAVVGNAEVHDVSRVRFDAATLTAETVANTVMFTLKTLKGKMGEWGERRLQEFLGVKGRTFDAAKARRWWQAWTNLSDLLPRKDLPGPVLRRLAVIRAVLDGSGHGGPVERSGGDRAVQDIRMACLRALTAATPLLPLSGEPYRNAWVAVFQANVDLDHVQSPAVREALAGRIDTLRRSAPEAFPDDDALLDWGRSLQPALAALATRLRGADVPLHDLPVPPVPEHRKAPAEPVQAPAAASAPQARPAVQAPPLPAAPVREQVRRGPMTGTGRKAYEALRARGPMYKVDIARAAGIGRGSGVRAVDHLVRDGWVVALGDGRYEALPAGA